MDKKRIGFGLTGSFCTVDQVIPMITEIKSRGHSVIPIVSHNLQSVDTRFGSSAHFLTEIEKCAEYKPVTSMVEAEGLGPSTPLDALVIAPMTGTSLSKFSQGISDTPVLFAAKATLRNNKPVVLAVSTNDGLGQNGVNIMALLKTKHIYFVPFTQDNPEAKPNSIVSEFSLITPTLEQALVGKQLQPVLHQKQPMI